MVTRNKDSGPKFEATVYIYEVNGARKVQSNAQVATNKNSNTVQKFLGVVGRTVPPTQIFTNF